MAGGLLAIDTVNQQACGLATNSVGGLAHQRKVRMKLEGQGSSSNPMTLMSSGMATPSSLQGAQRPDRHAIVGDEQPVGALFRSKIVLAASYPPSSI